MMMMIIITIIITMSVCLQVADAAHELPGGGHLGVVGLGHPKNTVRGYYLDIPRFEESPNN